MTWLLCYCCCCCHCCRCAPPRPAAGLPGGSRQRAGQLPVCGLGGGSHLWLRACERLERARYTEVGVCAPGPFQQQELCEPGAPCVLCAAVGAGLLWAATARACGWICSTATFLGGTFLACCIAHGGLVLGCEGERVRCGVKQCDLSAVRQSGIDDWCPVSLHVSLRAMLDAYAADRTAVCLPAA